MPSPLKLVRRGHLDDHPVQQHCHVVGNAKDLGNLMAHHDGCKPKLPLGLDDQVVDGPRQEGIQSRGRLVEQDDLRPHHERARQSRPLPHATAQLGWKLMAHPR